MREDFLYYIWRHQLFSMQMVSGDHGQIEVIKPGFRNNHDGPDFKEALIRIDGMSWYGAVEIHVKSSDWYAHEHHKDKNYDAVILHVVYEHDRAVKTTLGESIPTIALNGAIKPKFFERYKTLVENPALISCQHQLLSVPAIKRLEMSEKVLVERLERKSQLVLHELKRTNNDWQEVSFRMIAKAMGFKSNDEPMLELARRIQYKWIARSSAIQDIEGLLLGMGGFLQGGFKDAQMLDLQNRFRYIKLKYPELKPLELSSWRFAPLRPYNQPTQRLVQLAAILHQCKNLWDGFLTIDQAEQLIHQMKCELSPYWRTHLRPDKPMKSTIHKVSKNTIQHLLINVTSPMLAAFSLHQDDRRYMDRAINLLSQISAEQNRVTKLWKEMNWPVSSAFDSQALNELYQGYCSLKKCISCRIGVHLLGYDS